MKMSFHYAFLACLSILAATARRGWADGAESPLLQVPLAAAPLVLDGVLDEPAWSRSATFPMNDPVRAPLPPGWEAEIRLLRDAGNLYLGFRIANPYVPMFVKSHERVHDDTVYSDECIEIFIDTGQGDPATRQLIVNAHGSRYDGYWWAGGNSSDWDGDWQAATRIVRGAWYAELRVPFSDFAPATSIKINAARVSYTREGQTRTSAWQAPGWFAPHFRIDLHP